jgi:hypothetical protein
MIVIRRIGKCMERREHGQVEAFARRDQRKEQKTLVEMVGALARFRIEHLRNTSLEYCCFIKLIS